MKSKCLSLLLVFPLTAGLFIPAEALLAADILPAGEARLQNGERLGQHPGVETIRRQILNVSGSGRERVRATLADVRLAVEKRGATPEEAQRRMVERANPLIDYLRGQNLQQLETVSLHVQPIHDYSRGTQEIVGYQAMTVVRFRAEADEVSVIIDQAMQRGANQLQGLSFTAPEEVIEAARQKALRQAARLAQRRARAVLDELGLEEGRIVAIDLSPVDDQPVWPMRGARFEAARATADHAPPEVEAGEQEILAQVSLQISYLSR